MGQANVSYAILVVHCLPTWCIESSQIHVPSKSYKYPDPEGSHIGVQVKVWIVNVSVIEISLIFIQLYDMNVAEQLKSTDLATFVGILAHEPYVPHLFMRM